MAVLLFLDAFTKLQKATISFVMFAHPSKFVEQHWTDFHEI
jgi:hypothetical protein